MSVSQVGAATQAEAALTIPIPIPSEALALRAEGKAQAVENSGLRILLTAGKGESPSARPRWFGFASQGASFLSLRKLLMECLPASAFPEVL